MRSFLCVAFFLAAVAQAGTKEKDDIKKAKMDLDISSDKDGKFEIKAKMKDGSSKAEIDFKMEGEKHGVDARFQYKSDGEDKTKTAGKFRAKIYNLIEFVDTGAVGYDANDKVVKKYSLSDTYTLTTKDGEATITESAGIFSATVHYAAELKQITQKVGNRSVTNEVSMANLKIDYAINNFKFMQNDTKLAVEGRFKSKAKVEYGGKSKMTTEVDTGSNGKANVGFNWLNSVDVDGVEVDLVESAIASVGTADRDSTSETGEEEFKKYWTINKVGKHKRIVWDPSIGLSDGTTSSSFLVGPLSFLMALYLF